MQKIPIITTIVGAVAGAAGMYLYLNKKYEARYDREIQDIKDAFAKREDWGNNKSGSATVTNVANDISEEHISKPTPENPVDVPSEQNNHVVEYYRVIKDSCYKEGAVKSDSPLTESISFRPEIDPNDPEVMSHADEGDLIYPNEFGVNDDYNQFQIFYHEFTKEFTDDEGNEVEVDDMKTLLGEPAYSMIVAGQLQQVFVRNDTYEAYYAVELVPEEEDLADSPRDE